MSLGGVHTLCDVLHRIEARGEIKGAIKGTIRLNHKEMNMLPNEIKRIIMTFFSLSEEEAGKNIEEAIGAQPT